jgi:hypothetical protein
VRPLYKHILCWPVVLKDLEYLDTETFVNLAKLQEMDMALEDLCLDFTVTESFLGTTSMRELVPNGANVTLTETNLDQYLEANLKYRLCKRFEEQLGELLTGYVD